METILKITLASFICAGMAAIAAARTFSGGWEDDFDRWLYPEIQ